jgi:regulator of RNase E activity RraA
MTANPDTHTAGITRAPKAIVQRLKEIGPATLAGTLFYMGIRNSFMAGPVAWRHDQAVAGPALTLQFMPKREDMYGDGEYADVEKQLHRHVLYHVIEGDIVVVDARGDMKSGIFGEMMLTYFKGRGGAGLIVDGCIRDYPSAGSLGVPMWLRGVTPNFHTQTDLMPFAVNVPIACGGVTVMPGDIIVADADGAIVVPAGLAERAIDEAHKGHEWEDFSREMLASGGDLRRYYPLSDAARPEYEAWKKRR